MFNIAKANRARIKNAIIANYKPIDILLSGVYIPRGIFI